MKSTLLFATLALASAAVGGEAPALLTLDDAVRLALQHNPRLEGRRDSAAADGEDAKAVRGGLLPQVGISANYYNASSPESIDLGGLLGAGGASGGATPPPLSLHGFGAGLGIVTAS